MPDRAPRSPCPLCAAERAGQPSCPACGAGAEEVSRAVGERLDRILAYCEVELALAEPGELRALLEDETEGLQGSPVADERASRIDAALAALGQTLESTPLVRSVMDTYHAVAAASDSAESRAVIHAPAGPPPEAASAEPLVESWAIPVHRRLDESLFYECAHCGFLVGEGVAVCPACRAAFDPPPGAPTEVAPDEPMRPAPPQPAPEPLGPVRWKRLRSSSSPHGA